MADVLTINSTTINMVTNNTALNRCVLYGKGVSPELHFTRLVGKLATLPDPWSGKTCTLTMSSTLVFTGQIQGYIDRPMDDLGWVREYRALGLRNSADYVPVTDSNTLTDTATFNLPGDDPNFIGARAGLTVGAIVTQVLQMSQNASALTAFGIGNYSGSTLPSITTTDLSALTVIPQSRVTISGERILQNLEQLVQQYHPNHLLYIDPSGNIRFLDQRVMAASPTTVTMGGTGVDARWGLPQLTRDFSECFSQVEVRGNTLANIGTLQTLPWPGSASSDGGLQEAFAWGTFTTNALAIAAWLPSDWTQPSVNGDANDTGSCTCPTTLTVTVTSQNTSAVWASNFWAQGSGQAQGIIYLYADIITGVQQFFQARIVSNTALTAGGTSTLTLDRALPALTYNSYSIWGLAENANVVWRKYKVTNANIAAAMLNYFPYPVAIKGAAGNSASLTSSPQGYVWGGASSPPYNISTMGITLDPVNGFIYFDRPTALVYGGGSTTPPANVSVIVPIANGSLSTFAPSSTTYSGTLSTVEGIHRTKIITVTDWRDYGSTSTMATYATEFLDSVQDVVIEGTIPYYGLNTTFLLMGESIEIHGTTGSTSYTTGWESTPLPVLGCEIIFNSGTEGATSYQMNLQLSNRRGRFTADQFLRPAVSGAQLGISDPINPGPGPTPGPNF